MVSRLLEAIRSEELDGWLFSNFHHRDPLSDSLLGIPAQSVNSRRWLYALPAKGQALKIVHVIESHILDGLPGMALPYASMAELKAIIAERLSGQEWACHVSENIPVISHLDAGSLRLLESAGVHCVGAESLIQRARGLLDARGIGSHRRSADALAEIRASSWAFIRDAYRNGTSLSEGGVRSFILSAMDRAGLCTDHPPIVAAGVSSGDPHYDFQGEGRIFGQGDIVLLDMWAKGRAEDDIYADISWVGVFGDAVGARHGKMAQDLFAARDLALDTVRNSLRDGRPLHGREVDARTREFLGSLGYADRLRHRTGHGIDRECHGSGVNLDCVEFPDDRLILEGSCFSVEPGIYYPDCGMRTEIDVYVESGQAIVSGSEPQTSLLTCR
jgi:Xaa-Pro aminopeptidase